MLDERLARHTISRPSGTGKLTLFIGACPGVGKTAAMLKAAVEAREQGMRVLFASISAHRDPDVDSLMKRLDIVEGPSKEINLDEILKLKPDLLVINELIHTNLSGSRHKRRYQDISEILSAGINVYTTFDMLHMESLNDLVLQITGIQVHETLPDRFVDQADDLVFIDLPVAILMERFRQGRIHLPEYARQQPEIFYTTENLLALRELAIREVMHRIDQRLKSRQLERSPVVDYVINDRLLVLISNESDHEYLVRAGRQIADRRQIEWMVVWVDTGQPVMREDKSRLQSSLALAAELGARTEVIRGHDVYLTIIPYINIHHFNIVLVGAGSRQILRPWRKPLAQKLIESGLPLEVTVFRPPRQGISPLPFTAPSGMFSTGSVKEHLFGVLVAAIASVFAVLLDRWLSSGNLVLIYVLAVIIVGLKYGAVPAMTTVLFSFLSFDFFHAEPIYRFFPIAKDDVATMAFLVVIALLCGPAASMLRRQFILLAESNRYTESLRALGQKLTVADTERSVWLTLAAELARTLPAEVCIVTRTSEMNQLAFPEPATPFTRFDQDAIEWSYKQAVVAGKYTDTISQSEWTMFPVVKEEKCIAVAAIRFETGSSGIKPYDSDLIMAMLQQTGDAWQRIQLTGKLESAHLKNEVEQLRTALLSSVSHDLKSPLAAMIGAAETLNMQDTRLPADDRHELTDTILQESRRLESYIQNLLDMTRLGHGTLDIKRDWVSVDDVIGAALSRLRRYFPDIVAEYHTIEPAPLLYAQAVLIEQALYNILENAAKFSPIGEKIIIWVEQSENKCLINIEDKGPGIPESLREKIFDMFYAVASGDQKSQNSQNSGMGLAICRGMISAHGGRVRAEAGRGNTGTRFVVELPVDKARSVEQD